MSTKRKADDESIKPTSKKQKIDDNKCECFECQYFGAHVFPYETYDNAPFPDRWNPSQEKKESMLNAMESTYRRMGAMYRTDEINSHPEYGKTYTYTFPGNYQFLDMDSLSPIVLRMKLDKLYQPDMHTDIYWMNGVGNMLFKYIRICINDVPVFYYFGEMLGMLSSIVTDNDPSTLTSPNKKDRITWGKQSNEICLKLYPFINRKSEEPHRSYAFSEIKIQFAFRELVSLISKDSLHKIRNPSDLKGGDISNFQICWAGYSLQLDEIKQIDIPKKRSMHMSTYYPAELNTRQMIKKEFTLPLFIAGIGKYISIYFSFTGAYKEDLQFEESVVENIRYVNSGDTVFDFPESVFRVIHSYKNGVYFMNLQNHNIDEKSIMYLKLKKTFRGKIHVLIYTENTFIINTDNTVVVE